MKIYTNVKCVPMDNTFINTNANTGIIVVYDVVSTSIVYII